MPPVLFALAAAAGFFAAARLFAMAMDSHEDTWRQANEEPKEVGPPRGLEAAPEEDPGERIPGSGFHDIICE